MKIKSIHFQDVGPLGNQPIGLVNDWDDSLELNYGKFGDLLERVKIVTGGASDD